MSGAGIFAGLRIADFSWVMAGPITTRFFAAHGATVVRIESGERLDITRRMNPFKDGVRDPDHSGIFPVYNCGKYGITLNLSHPTGRRIARQIAGWADVIVESFRPGQMRKWALDYEALRQDHPDLIMLGLSMQGQTGPHASHPGYGVELQSLSGFTSLLGWPDGEPLQPFGAYTDFVAPYFAASALICALEHRRQTGEGAYIDISQYEASLQFIAPLLMDFFSNGRVAVRTGNRSVFEPAAPEGAYRCQGEDAWCVISAKTEADWRNLSGVLGQSGLLADPRFEDLPARLAHADELDRLIEEWTRQRPPAEAVAQLQQAGLIAAVVHDTRGIVDDPQLRHRGHFVRLPHSAIGDFLQGMLPFRLAEHPPTVERAAPCLGEHNFWFYTEVLGMAPEQFVELENQGVFA